MKIAYDCPQCGKTVECPPSAAGTPFKCPYCGRASLVPQGWNRPFVAAMLGAGALLLAILVFAGYQLFGHSSATPPAKAANSNVRPAESDAGLAVRPPTPEPPASPGGGGVQPSPSSPRPPVSGPPPVTPSAPVTPPAPPPVTPPPTTPTPPVSPPAQAGPAWARILLHMLNATNCEGMGKQSAERAKQRNSNWPDSSPFGVSVSFDAGKLVAIADVRRLFGPADKVSTATRDLGRRELGVQVEEHVYGSITLQVRKGQKTVAYLVAPLGWWIGGIRSKAQSAISSGPR